MGGTQPAHRRVHGPALVLAVILACACGSNTPVASTQTSPSPTAVVSSQSAKPSAGACTTLSCHMTKPTDAYGVPLPDDAKPHGSTGTVFESMLGTPNDFIAFYDSYLRGKGWMLDLKYSHEPSGSQFYYTHVFCFPGPEPVDNVSVIVGPLVDGDQAGLTKMGAQIGLVGPDKEGTCP